MLWLSLIYRYKLSLIPKTYFSSIIITLWKVHSFLFVCFNLVECAYSHNFVICSLLWNIHLSCNCMITSSVKTTFYKIMTEVQTNNLIYFLVFYIFISLMEHNLPCFSFIAVINIYHLFILFWSKDNQNTFIKWGVFTVFIVGVGKQLMVFMRSVKTE